MDSFEERQDDRSHLRLIVHEGSVEDFVAVHPGVQKHRRDRTLSNCPYAVVRQIHRRDDSFEERFAKSLTLFVFVAHRHRFETRVSEGIRGDGDAGVWNYSVSVSVRTTHGGIEPGTERCGRSCFTAGLRGGRPRVLVHVHRRASHDVLHFAGPAAPTLQARPFRRGTQSIHVDLATLGNTHTTRLPRLYDPVVRNRPVNTKHVVSPV